MPAATSNPSVSPARRPDHRNSLPHIQSGQNPFSNPRPLQSPQASYSNGYGPYGTYGPPGSDSRRGRGSFGITGTHVMPTPDPTVGSCMSEEDKDVAIQLMRLGEVSTHGRASASTLDDTFSGKADAASSTGATSDAESCSEDDVRSARRQKVDASGSHREVFNTTESHFVGPQDSAEASGEEADCSDGDDNGSSTGKASKAKAKNTLNGPKPRARPTSKSKPSKATKPKAKKASNVVGPMSPASLPASRKPSISSNPAVPLAPGEEEQPDLSTKPRCQRCRKSKKGCDRQRPCGRCADAGIPAELCISEDEGNGRKGRYGRHMGVPIKKVEMPPPATHLLPAAPIATATPIAPTSAPGAIDKTKKRKR